MCSGPHKSTTLMTGGKQDRQKPKPNRKPRFFLQNLPKPIDSKIFETVTTLHESKLHKGFCTSLIVAVALSSSDDNNTSCTFHTMRTMGQNQSNYIKFTGWRHQSADVKCTLGQSLLSLIVFFPKMFSSG